MIIPKLSDYFKDDGTPIKCFVCGCPDLKDRVMDAIEHTVCEVEVSCAHGHKVGYWAYGSWDPGAMENAQQLISRMDTAPSDQ